MFFSVPGVVVANDGVATVSGSGLTISSSPFNFSIGNSLDHVKYLTFLKNPFSTITPGDEILFEAQRSGIQTGTDTLPSVFQAAPGSLDGIDDVASDPRPCCAAFNVVDFENLIVFDFIITPKIVYALVERLPFNTPPWGGNQTYNAYTHLIPVYKRNSSSIDDMLNLGISYNYHTSCVKWFISNKEVFRINNPGYFLAAKYRVTQIDPIGTPAYPQTLVRSPKLWVGFGTFSLLEESNPLNPDGLINKGLLDFTMNGYFPYADANAALPSQPSVALKYMAELPDVNYTTCYGQGADLRIKKLKVSRRKASDHIKIGLSN
jgi:hypothetical protein